MSNVDLDLDLRTIALRGVFSAARARRAGIDGAMLRRLVQRGLAHPVHRGWYTPYRPGDGYDRLRLRTTALLFEYGDVAVASHGSAVVMLGLPVEGVDLGTAHLMWTGERSAFRAFSRVRLHEQIDDPAIPASLDTVHPALACVQVGLADARALVVAGDAALRRGIVSGEQLRLACAALRGHRGVTRARATVELCDARHESPGESVTAFVLHLLGYVLVPQFEPGLSGPGGGPVRVDFRIAGTRVLVEFDGKGKYAGRDEDEVRELLFAEKRREDALRGLDFDVVRLVWSDLSDPETVRSKVEAALARSRARRP